MTLTVIKGKSLKIRKRRQHSMYFFTKYTNFESKTVCTQYDTNKTNKINMFNHKLFNRQMKFLARCFPGRNANLTLWMYGVC